MKHRKRKDTAAEQTNIYVVDVSVFFHWPNIVQQALRVKIVQTISRLVLLRVPMQPHHCWQNHNNDLHSSVSSILLWLDFTIFGECRTYFLLLKKST